MRAAPRGTADESSMDGQAETTVGTGSFSPRSVVIIWTPADRPHLRPFSLPAAPAPEIQPKNGLPRTVRHHERNGVIHPHRIPRLRIRKAQRVGTALPQHPQPLGHRFHRGPCPPPTACFTPARGRIFFASTTDHRSGNRAQRNTPRAAVRPLPNRRHWRNRCLAPLAGGAVAAPCRPPRKATGPSRRAGQEVGRSTALFVAGCSTFHRTYRCGLFEVRPHPPLCAGPLARGRPRSTRLLSASTTTARPGGTREYSEPQLPDFALVDASGQGSRARCGCSHT